MPFPSSPAAMRVLILAAALATAACAQPSTPPAQAASAPPTAPPVPTRTLADDDWCDDVRSPSNRAVACEVRETVTRADALDLAARNGSVTVKRWDRSDVLVRSRVLGVAPSEAEAQALVDQTEVRVSGGEIRATTPDDAEGRGVSVSYEVFAPGRTDLAVSALNGPLGVHGLTGTIVAEAVNGPVEMSGVAGDVSVTATNGPVSMALEGRRWGQGGLTVETTNGPVLLALPRGYSARLSASTEMGRISAEGVALPARERRRMGDAVEAVLGDGGAPITLRAQNGPVRITATD